MTETAAQPVPGPGDLERDTGAERASKIPDINLSAIDPRKLALGAAIGGGLLFAALSLASGSDAPVAPPKVAAEKADTVVPYDPGAVIAPTLATASDDPNAPVALTAQQVPPIDPSLASLPPPAPTAQAPQTPQKSERQILADASRRATLLAFGGEREGANPNGSRAATLDPSIPDGQSAPREPTNLDNLRRASTIGRAQARVIGNRNYLLAAGTFIPCVLQTAMDSSQPGFVSCVIPRDIYSDNGRVVLMEKGTKLVGEYQGGLNRGQYRLFVLWNRAVTPQGIAIDVSSPATDSLGRSGADGRVNNFFWKRFGAALLFSLVEDASQVAAQAVGNRGDNVTQVPSEATGIILQDSNQIRPVLTKNQGEDVGITVAQDFDFSAVYGLQLK